MQCGPIRFITDVKSQIAKQSFDRFLIPRFTSYNSILEDRLSIATLYKYLSEDEIRNNIIVEDICKAVNTGRTPIILTNRTAHVSVLAEKLKATIKNVISLTGIGTTKEKREAMQRLQTIPDSEQLVIVATGKYVGEGFDYPRLDTLFLALPISWKGLLTQYAGRLHREYEGKKDVRIYIDIHEPICDSMYRKRLKGYAAIGYKTINTAQPTLFDHINDMSSSIVENQIFNGSTFYRPYTSDLTKAKRSIVISSPKLYRTEQNPLVTLLKELAQQGIEILITTVAENEQTAFIQSKGLSVKVKPKLSLYTTIIDKEVVWYGSINTLGYASKDDNMIKVTDIHLANELIEMIHKHS